MKYLMRENLDDSYGFLKLQNKILEIAVYIDSLCKANNIDYCLMGGSALGAKRHGGFIPWDDDLDIFMTPDNYEKFRNIFNSIGDKEKYYLQEYGLIDNMVTMPKLRLNGTTYIEETSQNMRIHQGIYIDIFILHNCPDNKLARWYQYIWAKYVVIKGLATRNYSKRVGTIGLILRFLRLFPDKFLMKYALKQVYKYRNKNTHYFCNYLGKALLKKGTYKREHFVPTEYVPFETVQLKAPCNLHSFLTNRFGDYMVPPSSESIKWQQHAMIWDVDKDFSEYVNPERSFKDERKLI